MEEVTLKAPVWAYLAWLLAALAAASYAGRPGTLALVLTLASIATLVLVTIVIVTPPPTTRNRRNK